MNDTNIYKTRLEKEQESLEAQLTTIARPSTENPEEWEAIQVDVEQESDPNDQASELDQYQENRAIVSVLNARNREVRAALERIENGTYGTCEVGGEQIEEERLSADPTARTCLLHLS
jgi:RNA polymerase-binding transcription factor DksA